MDDRRRKQRMYVALYARELRQALRRVETGRSTIADARLIREFIAKLLQC